MPTLQNTQFGWVVSGLFVNPNQTKQITSSCHLATLESELRKFWEIEDIPESSTKYTLEEQYCEEHFLNSHSRAPEGRFVLSLPMTESTSSIGYSKSNAVKRLLSMERKFSRDDNLQKDYVEFMTEYCQLGHMRLLDANKTGNTPIYHLPHHAVTKTSSLTTKLRVVFDGLLFVGPTIQQNLFSLNVRFRSYNFVLTADIKKMYRQILIDPTQAPLQTIVWRKHPPMK